MQALEHTIFSLSFDSFIIVSILGVFLCFFLSLMIFVFRLIKVVSTNGSPFALSIKDILWFPPFIILFPYISFLNLLKVELKNGSVL